MIGPGIATVKLNGKQNPFYRIVIPKSLVTEIAAKDIMLEDRDQVRIWIEQIGIKTPKKRNAFGIYNKETEAEKELREAREEEYKEARRQESAERAKILQKKLDEQKDREEAKAQAEMPGA